MWTVVLDAGLDGGNSVVGELTHRLTMEVMLIFDTYVIHKRWNSTAKYAVTLN